MEGLLQVGVVVVVVCSKSADILVDNRYYSRTEHMLMGKGSGTRVGLVPCNKLKRHKLRIITSFTNAKAGCLQYEIVDPLLLCYIECLNQYLFISTLLRFFFG